eukprot:gene60-gene347
MYKSCSHGNLLHFSLQQSQLNSCYYHQDLHVEDTISHDGLTIGRSLQRHPFSGLVHSAGELLHTP